MNEWNCKHSIIFELKRKTIEGNCKFKRIMELMSELLGMIHRQWWKSSLRITHASIEIILVIKVKYAANEYE